MRKLLIAALALTLAPIAASEAPPRHEPLRPSLERLDAYGGEVVAASGRLRAVHGSLPPRVNWPSGEAKAWVDGRPSTARILDHRGERLTLKLDGAAKGSKVSVDYNGFRHASGGDWASRLRLWEGGTALPTANDTNAGVVSAQAQGNDGVFTLAAAASGSSGDFTATSLSPSATWAAGGNAGGFTWSYPLRVPPAPGPRPNLSLGYSSSSVDGRSEATNNQPSVLGEGFEYSPGYIERRYVACADDMADGASNLFPTGDQCWRSDNAVMSLNGAGGELIFETGKGWHARAENGSRIEKLTGASNGDNEGEYWKVTTPDGTQYFFGRHSLPGHSTGTESVYTVPVFGNHAGEPCRGASFAASSCVQAYRWNLDYVVDVRGNTMSLWYEKETNKYARLLNEGDDAEYTRDGVLRRIDYGTYNRNVTDHGVAESSTTPVAQVLFDYGDRCLAGTCWSNGTPVKANWPDTPVDQRCAGDSCPQQYSPTYWTMKRLTSVTTKVGAQAVESWEFQHSFPSTGDGTHAGLWLRSIVHKGHVGGTVTLPPITFEPVAMANRVLTQNTSTNNWQRIAKIVTETGARIHVEYSDPECAQGNLPASPESNGKLCYPVKVPDYTADPNGKKLKNEWWHKYVVTRVFEDDIEFARKAPAKVTSYRYVGSPAWRYADDDGVSKPDRRTWSQYRGYATVETRTGAEAATQTLEVATYLRGMHGDRVDDSGGSRVVTVGASLGTETVYDEDAFAGMVREQAVFNGLDTKPVSKSVNVPWQSPPTASRGSVHARHSANAVTYKATALGTDGARGWRTTRDTQHFDDVYGMVDWAQSEGDLNVTGDEKCTTTAYNRNTVKNLITPVRQVTTLALLCGRTPGAVDDVISDVRNFHDGATDTATPPKFGSVTRVDQLKDWTGSTQWQTVKQSTYDSTGREKTATDIRGNTVTASYTPAVGGPVTGISALGPFDRPSVVELSPYWGVKVRTTDPNGTILGEAEFDPLGRTRKVWSQGWTRSGHENQPSVEYTYDLAPNRDRYPFVKTRTLNARGGYVTSYEILDALMRARQTQVPALDGTGARVVTDTIHDSHGRVAATYAEHAEPGVPSASLWWEPEWSVPAISRTEYDRASRPIAEVLLAGENDETLVEKWRIVTFHEGDLTRKVPPQGGVATTAKTDAQGRTVELIQPASAVSYVYNRKDQLTKMVDAALNEWVYTYDAKGRKRVDKDPDKGTTRLEYNDFNDLEKVTDATGEVLVTVYDSLGRKKELRDDSRSGPLRAEWKYDTLYSGQTGFRGQLTQAIRYEPPGGAQFKWQVRQMNRRYQATGVNYVIPEEGLAGNYIYGYEFSEFTGAPTAIAYPAAGDLPAEKVTTTYDAVTGLATGLNTDWVNAGGTMFVQEYDAYGRRAADTRMLPNGLFVRQVVDYDALTGRVSRTRIKPETAADTVSDRNYRYDASGNIKSIQDKTELQCFRYDSMARLDQAWTPKTQVGCDPAASVANLDGPEAYWMTWDFDAQGNRISETTHSSGGAAARTYALPAGGATVARPHAVTSMTAGGTTVQYRYDAEGNMICRPLSTAANNCDTLAGSQSLSWTPEGRLASVAVAGREVESGVYDADGKRLLRRDSAGKTLYLPDQEIRREGTVSTGTRHYPVGATRTASGVTWVYSDHQGTQQISVSAGTQAVTVRRQTPYGASRGAAAAWPSAKSFVGGDRDPGGLVNVGARRYDPALGRFISVDPLMVTEDPAQWDGYQYAASNPISKSDPEGTCVVDDETGKCDRAQDRALAAARAASKPPAGCGNPNFVGPCPVNYDKGDGGGCFGGDRQTGVCTPGVGSPAPHVEQKGEPFAQPNLKPVSTENVSWAKKVVINGGLALVGNAITSVACKAVVNPFLSLGCSALAGAIVGAVGYWVLTKLFEVEQYSVGGLISATISGFLGGIGNAFGGPFGKWMVDQLKSMAVKMLNALRPKLVRLGWAALTAAYVTIDAALMRAIDQSAECSSNPPPGGRKC